jgi:acyl-[acyl-carrier-protein]-phospholipid O-acyltransferase/long-chain-fatty-acid--[acyl-carrier-protein] ligase
MAVMGAAVLVWAVSAWREKKRAGLTYLQALRRTFFKFAFGVDFDRLDHSMVSSATTLFLVSSQSRLDRSLLSSSLPAGTFHIDLNRNPDYVFTLLKSVLEGHAGACLYVSKEVEASAETMQRLERAATIASSVGARIVPIYIRGARHSLLSYWSRRKAPRSLLPQIVVSAAPAFMLPNPEAPNLADHLLDGMMLAKFRATNLSQTLFEAIATAARVSGAARQIIDDAMGAKFTYRQLLIGARVLAVRFAAESTSREVIGVLLPNSTGAVLATIALFSAGRPMAMLNYTAGPAALVSALQTAQIKTIIASRAFVEKADLGNLVEAISAHGKRIIYLEDVRQTIAFGEKVMAFLAWRQPVTHRRADDPAVILFTSGSEGMPKAVVLSSRNLIANAAQANCRVDVSPADTLLNVLPLFHSFGILGGMLLPLLYGIRLYLYPSPLHYKLVAATARKTRPTVMFGTDTFLRGYARAAKDGDFDSLRMIVAGAEPVKTDTRESYRERFGVRIVEGYGLTEASPVVAVNSSTFFKDGSVGRLLPGMEMRLEQVDGIDDGGRLFIMGPNLMQGYILPERPGELQFLGGKWHDTGDLVSVDERGFITIKGRVKRFAKIAGEMVSLGAVEAMAQQFWPDAQHAAVAVPDPRRGERVVLLTTQSPAERSALIAHAKRAGVTELMLPDDIVHVDAMPVLGSGKTDYPATSALVRARLAV